MTVRYRSSITGSNEPYLLSTAVAYVRNQGLELTEGRNQIAAGSQGNVFVEASVIHRVHAGEFNRFY
jgi:hypothetical protein